MSNSRPNTPDAPGQLLAGFGRGEINFPQELFPVEQFSGVHDAPCARLMVLECSGSRMAIAALEMVNVPPKGIELCQRIVEEKTGIPQDLVWVHVTHAISTMHEPGPMGPPEDRPPLTQRHIRQKELYFAAIESAVTEAAEQAAESFGPAKLGWASGSCEVNVNRDIQTPYGWWNGQNPEGPSNKTMSVLRVEDPEGDPKGFLISYGIKPCAIDNAGMEDGTRRVSADVCGVCSRMMEERFGAPALFCVSAAGDQVPREQAWWESAAGDGLSVPKDLGVDTGLEIAGRLGRIMGQDAIAIAGKAHCVPGTESSAKIRRGSVSFAWETKYGRPKGPGAPPESFPAEGQCQVGAEIFTLGGAAFVAEKPEVNCQTELELLDRSPYERSFIVCMVNGGMKYMPDRLAYERNTFEAQSSMLQPGAAERFVQEVVSELNRLKAEEKEEDRP